MDQVINEAKVGLEESEHDEKASQAAYEELMADSKKSRAEMSKSLVGKESEMASLEGSLNDEKNARGATNEELMATNEYLAEVHSANDWLIENYDARKEARAAELDNLTKAKAVLSGADFQ